MFQHFSIPLVFAVVGALVRPAAGAGVQITQQPDRLRVEINGEFFTEYFFTHKSHPWAGTVRGPEGKSETVTNWPKHVYFYPVIGPGGTPMTRNWPMKDVPGEDHDHPHHRSLWFSHGAVNGIDFWAETPKSGQIAHDRFLEVKSGSEVGIIRSANKWIAPDGQVICTDEQTVRIHARPAHERLLDFEVTIKAPEGRELVLGDTKEGSMAVRINEAMRLSHGRGKAGAGRIVLSTGVRDSDTWGNRAAWCDYYAPVEGKTVGIAIFDHPSNHAHPTWWHVRDYGLFAANPFGVHDFEKKPAGTGNLVVAPGKSVTFKYRIYIHEGDEQQARVAERYKDYTAGK